MLHYIDSFPDRILETKSGNYHYFGGTAYLGLQTHKEFKQLYIKNIMHYGTHYGASRVSNVRFSIFEKAELYLANLVGSEACITLSSGFLATQLLGQYFAGLGYTTFRTPYSHDSFSSSGQIYVKSYNELQQALNSLPPQHKTVIYLDSIDFIGLNYPDFKGLKDLDLRNCIVVMDDSHGFGILGKKGGGTMEYLREIQCKEILVCGSLGKGFGLQLGGVFGSKNRIDKLIQSAVFGGSSPATPATMATIVQSQHIVNSQRTKLEKNLALFKTLLQRPEYFIFFGDHPTFTFKSEELCLYLYQNKVIVTSFNYPTKDSPIMSRIVISAFHTRQDIEHLASLINEYKKPPKAE